MDTTKLKKKKKTNWENIGRGYFGQIIERQKTQMY